MNLVYRAGNQTYKIEHDENAGFYIYVLDSEGKCVADYLQVSLGMALKFTNHKFGLNADGWKNTPSKSSLDQILTRNRAQPAGRGYADIIVPRQFYRSFVAEVIEMGFQIKSISWWEYCETLDSRPKYGLGGPRSWYLPGWFPEIPVPIDEVPQSDDLVEQQRKVLDFIENKVLGVGVEQLTFLTTTALTPGFWLEVPDNWEYQRPELP